jgi:predicted outer membrane protein
MRVRTTILIPALVATAAVAAFGLTGFAQAADQGTGRLAHG